MAAIWIKEAPGIARTVAEWMTDGKPEIDPHGSDIARFYDHQQDASSTSGPGRPRASTRPTASSTRWSSGRPTANVRLSPFNARERELGAVFFEAAGWERPFWYGANEALLAEYGDRVDAARRRVGVALVVADHQRRAPRDARSGRDGRPVRVRDLRRDRAGRLRLPRAPVRQPGSTCAPGRIVYTPLLNRGRRDPGRPHDHAARPRPVPGRDRRRPGHARQEAVRRRPARGRLGPAPRRDQPVDDDRAVGAAGARHPGRGDGRATSATPASRS